MQAIFYSCISLKSIDLSSFNTSKVENLNYAFYNCKSLISLNLSNFKTPKLIVSVFMFEKCSNLTFLNLSNFDFSETLNIYAMFLDCISLKTVIFPKLQTPKLQNIEYLFKNCKSLIYVDLSYFTTSNITHMDNAFHGCESLISLNLSNFDISKTTWIESMFEGCSKLQYINLKNAIETNNSNFIYTNIFKNTPENMIICINETNSPILTNLFKQKNNMCYRIDCSDDWISKQKKIIKEEGLCIEKCNNSINYKYEFNGICHNNCTYGTFLDKIDSIEKCKCENEKCLLCSDIESIKNLCITCNELFYPIENDPVNIGPYINCYKDPIGYYLDKSDKNNYIYKLCYKTCKNCLIKGDDINHNCLECNSNYPLGISNNNYTNCYKNCSYYYYFDEFGNFTCTSNYSCPKEYNKLQIDKGECLFDCKLDDTNKYEFRNICYKNCPKESIESKIKDYYCEALCNEEKSFVIIETQECVEFCDIFSSASKSCVLKYVKEIEDENNKGRINKEKEAEIIAQNKFIESIEKAFTSKNYDTSDLDNGNDTIIENEKITITLTTIENQKNNYNKNISTIDLNECENILRNVYDNNINVLYIKKIDVKQEGMKIPKIEYDVYSKLNSTNLIKLNLSFCQNSKINLFVPVILTESIDKFNSSSKYYTDICYTSTSDNGTDIILKDRKNEFIEGNKTVCQEECDFSGYDYNTKKVRCSCNAKQSSSSFEFMNINKTKLLNNFIDIKNIANINILKCYNILFSKEGINNNIGSFIIIPIIIFHFICIILFNEKILGVIKNKIKNIIFAIKNSNIVKKEKMKNNRLKNEGKGKDKISIKNKFKNYFNALIVNKKERKEKINKRKININSRNKNDLKKDDLNPPKKQKFKIKRNNKIVNNNNINAINDKMNINNKNYKSNIQPNSSAKEEIIDKTKTIMTYNNQELNQLSYKLALKYDGRTFCEYYISLIKIKHNLIFSLFYKEDYNSRLIKIDLYLISFIIYYTINTLFFNDNTMHKIYIDKGNNHIISNTTNYIFFNNLLCFKYSFKIFIIIRK